MGEAEEQHLIGNYPDYPIRDRLISDLKRIIEKSRGRESPRYMAVTLAMDWEETVERTWQEFLAKSDEFLDHVYGKEGAPQTEEQEIADFQWLYKRRFGVELSIEEAKATQERLLGLLKFLYEIDEKGGQIVGLSDPVAEE